MLTEKSHYLRDIFASMPKEIAVSFIAIILMIFAEACMGLWIQ
jgi:hypothetical protein